MEFQLVDHTGAAAKYDFNMSTLAEAQAAGSKHPIALLNSKVKTLPEQPTASQQVYHQMGFGRRDLTLADALNSTAYQAGPITNDGSITGRIVTAAYLMDAIENKLVASDSGILALFNSQAAVVDSIPDTRFDRPVLDFSRPEAARSRPIAQLSEPASMLTITTSDRSYKISNTTIGIEYSDEAARNVSLPIVTLGMTRQAEVEALERVERQLLAFVNGDTDLGMVALSSVSGAVTTAASFDSTISAAGALTQTAWVKWLFNNSRKRKITTVITDIAGALAIEKRTGRPTVTGDNGTSKRIDVLESVINPTWPDSVSIILSQDPNWPANTIVGFDKTYGYHIVNSTTMSYSAMEEYAMRRSTKMRIDSGSISYRLFDDAWAVLSLTV